MGGITDKNLHDFLDFRPDFAMAERQAAYERKLAAVAAATLPTVNDAKVAKRVNDLLSIMLDVDMLSSYPAGSGGTPTVTAKDRAVTDAVNRIHGGRRSDGRPVNFLPVLE